MDVKSKEVEEQPGPEAGEPLLEPPQGLDKKLKDEEPELSSLKKDPQQEPELSSLKKDPQQEAAASPEAASVPFQVSRMEGPLKVRLCYHEKSTAGLKTQQCYLLGTRFRWFKSSSDAAHSRNIQGEITVVDVDEWDGKALIGHYQNAFVIKGESVKKHEACFIHCSASTAEVKASWMSATKKAIADEKASVKTTIGVKSSKEEEGVDVGTESELQNKKTKKVGGATTAAAVAGAFVGSLVLPGLGTVAGATIAGYWANKHTRSQRDRQGRAAAVREEDYKHLQELDTQCTKCHVNFRLLKSREYCFSCALPFCHSHCSQKMPLPQLDEFKPMPICDFCAQRQDFINFIFVLTHYIGNMNDFEGHVECIVAAGGSLFPPSERLAVNKLFEGEHFDALECLSLLDHFVDQPEAFAMTIAQMARFVECRPADVEFYWSQMIGFVRTLIHSLGEDFGSIQLVLYAYTMRAVAWRNMHLRLKAAWEYLAIYDDAVQSNNILLAHASLFMVLIMVPLKEFKDVHVVRELLLRDVPDHQMEHMAGACAEMQVVMRAFEAHMPSILYWNWLLANTKEKIEACRKEVLELEATGGLVTALGILPGNMGSFEHRGSTASGSEAGTGRLDTNLSVLAQSGMPSPHEEAQPGPVVAAQAGEEGPFPDLRFEGMIRFVKLLTDIPEELRHLDRKRRRECLPLMLDKLQAQLNGTLYLPICWGGDPLKKILTVVKSESKVFPIERRAPTLIAFEVQCLPEPVCRTLYTSPLAMRGGGEQQAASTTTMSGALGGSVRQIGSSLQQEMAMKEGEASGESAILKLPVNTMCESGGEESPRSSSSSTSEDESMSEAAQKLALEKLEADERLHDRQPLSESDTDQQQRSEDSWAATVERCRSESSVAADLPDWGLQTVVSKSFDDNIRQEAFILQLLELFQTIFVQSRLNLWVKPYKVVCTGPKMGLMEPLVDAHSLDHLKEREACQTLKELYEKRYGLEGSPTYVRAREHFIKSMAAYSAVCYILQIKDRHNGNILLDSEGHVLHVEFGFVLGLAPGGAVSIETAPFKLTVEMVELMGGVDSEGYQMFKDLFLEAFLAARANADKLLALVALTSKDHSPYPCFVAVSPSKALKKLRSRFLLELSDKKLHDAIDGLVKTSYNHWGTRQYDSYQSRTNKIRP